MGFTPSQNPFWLKRNSLLKNPSTPLPGRLKGLKYPPSQCFDLAI
jgi:hypothetical protein